MFFRIHFSTKRIAKFMFILFILTSDSKEISRKVCASPTSKGKSALLYSPGKEFSIVVQ
jgi:hypothetical protein